LATPAAILSILVTANSRQAQAELLKVNKQLSATETRSDKMRKAAGAAGLALGGALALGARAGFRELAQGAKATAQTNAVLKSTGGIANVSAKQVDKLATSILKKSGIDDEAVKSGENMLLTFTRIRNETGRGNDIFNQATKAVADMAVAMNHGAVPSAQKMAQTSIQLGKALQDPVKGATALRRVGVVLTEQQQEQIKAFVASGQQMKAQKIILGELNREFGGSAAAAGKTLPGQLNILRETFNNLAGSVVQVLVPALQALVGPMQSIADFMSKHSTIAKILTGTLVALAVTLGVVAVAEKAFAAATKIATAAQWLFNAALTANPIGLVIVALAALGVGVVVAYKKFKPFREAVNGVWGALRDTFNWAKAHWPLLASILGGPFVAAGIQIAKHFDSIRNTVVGFINDIIDVINKLPFVQIGHVGGGQKSVGNPNIPHQKLAKGGFVNKPIAIMGEEAPAHPEWVVPTNPAYRKRAMGLWAAAGHDIGVPGFALGGALSKAGSIARSVTGLDLPSNPLKGTFLSKMGSWILHKAGGYIAGKAGDALSLPGKALKGIFGGSKGNFSTDGHPANIIKAFLPFIGLAHRDGLSVTSTTDGRHVQGSNHYTGHAVDFADGAGSMMKFARQALGFAPRLRELFYDPLGVYVKNGSIVKGAIGGHSDHVHLALAQGGVFSAAAMASLAGQAGFPKSVIPLAVAIALAESGGRANASNRNSDGSIDRGLWQINSIHGGLSTFNPLANARAAYSISGGGRNWNPWTVYRTGAYKKFLGRATKVAGKAKRVATGGGRIGAGSDIAGGGGFGGHIVGQAIGGGYVPTPGSAFVPAAPAAEDSGELTPAQQALIDALNADTEAQNAAAEAARALAEQQAALKAEVATWNAFSSSVANITSIQAIKALADVMSGQMGALTAARGTTASWGSTVRY
jgi:hypothetical protein